jgi:hypothetical protein
MIYDFGHSKKRGALGLYLIPVLAMYVRQLLRCGLLLSTRGVRVTARLYEYVVFRLTRCCCAGEGNRDTYASACCAHMLHVLSIGAVGIVRLIEDLLNACASMTLDSR